MIILSFRLQTIGKGGLLGYVSWETIAKALINGVKSDLVKDYVDSDIAILSPDTPLIKAVDVVRQHDFAVVLAKDKSLFGIVTVSDITSQFISDTEPFVLLNELECHLRNILKDKILLDDMKKLCIASSKTVNTIDDLTFGDYIALFSNPDQWEKIGVSADRQAFVSELEKAREIRNEIMHFSPNGVNTEDLVFLKNLVKYLRYLTKLSV